MKIKVVNIIKGTPARVNRNTGTVYVSAWHFKQMNPTQRRFVLYHELAHYLFKTKNEQMADEYAMMRMIKEGYKISDILKAMNNLLNNTRAHYGRKLNLISDARVYDYVFNHNKKSLKPILK